VSHHHHTDYVEVVSAKGPQKLSGAMRGLFITMTVVGFAAFLLLLFLGQEKIAWISYLHNFYFFAGLSAGGLLIAAIVHVARAMWGRPIKRFGESFGAFLPWTLLLLLPLWFVGGEHLYEWMEWPRLAAEKPEVWASIQEVYPHKVSWLSQHFTFGRVLLCLLILIFLGRRFMKLSLRPDLGLAHEKNPDLWSQPSGWNGLEAEVEKSYESQFHTGVLYCFAFAFCISMIAYDLIMSLDYRWFSTMFGGWNFTSFILISWASLYLMTARLSADHGLEKYMHRKLYHDLGKLIFGFTVVWGYLFFAQLMVIWYGNLSHESGYLITRIHNETWSTYSWTAAVMVFLIPFAIGLGKVRKMYPKRHGIIVLISILGIWLERFCLIAPASWNYDRHNMVYEGGVGGLLLADLAVSIGFLGLFLLVVTNYLYKQPLMVISDPRLDEGINRH